MPKVRHQNQSGIYRIVRIESGEEYIGQSIDCVTRWEQHKYRLSRDIHDNQRLQRAWNKYGPEAFVFEVLEYVPIDKDLLTAREQHYLDTRQPEYNICLVAESTLGVVRTEETRRRMSAALKGHQVSSDTRLRQRLAKLGTHPTPETNKKRAEAIRRSYENPSEKRLRSFQAQIGRKLPPKSEETKRRISEAKRGKPITDARRAALAMMKERGLTARQIAANTARRGQPPTEAQIAYWNRIRGNAPSPKAQAANRARRGKPPTEAQLRYWERMRKLQQPSDSLFPEDD